MKKCYTLQHISSYYHNSLLLSSSSLPDSMLCFTLSKYSTALYVFYPQYSSLQVHQRTWPPAFLTSHLLRLQIARHLKALLCGSNSTCFILTKETCLLLKDVDRSRPYMSSLSANIHTHLRKMAKTRANRTKNTLSLTNFPIDMAVETLRREMKKWREPSVTHISRRSNDPFRVLVSCLISLRTKDEVTRAASHRLFQLASSPEQLAVLPVAKIERAIYPAGFYHTKAARLKALSRILIDQYEGNVPDDLPILCSIKGIGRKTANLVLTRGFGKPGICVDTHVHRITNRWGYVTTKTPKATEMQLRKILPRKYWISINDLLVAFGQNVCVPVSPKCSECRLETICKKVNIERHR